MSHKRGYYLMSRGWMKHCIFEREAFSKRDAWVWLIENANFKDNPIYNKGTKFIIKRGEIATSHRKLQTTWKWSQGKVTRYLKRLINEGMIDTQVSTGFTLIRVTNYDNYQFDIDTEASTGINAPTATNQKKENNTKKEKNVTKREHVKTELGQYLPYMPEIPDSKNLNWFPNEWWDWALQEKLHEDYSKPLEDVVLQFCDHHLANGTAAIDWFAKWRKWCRDEKID